MLKRYQVLLNDWLVDYVKFIAERYDWSFSETMRLIMSVEIISWAAARFPKYPRKITNKILASNLKKFLRSPEKLQEEFHKEISKIYFEARKAAEFIMANENSKRK